MRGERRLLPDLGLLAVGQATAQLLNLVALVYLARHLGDRGFGLVQVGVAVSAYAMITAEWGLFSLGIRDIARLDARQEVLNYARVQQGLLAVLAVAVLAAGLLILPLLPFFAADPQLFRLYLLLVVPQVFMQEWIGTGLQRMPWVTAVKIAASLLYAAAVVLGLRHLDGVAGWPALRWVPVLYLLSYGLGGMLIAAPVARWLGGWVRPTAAPRRVWARRLRAAAPLGGAIVLLRLLINGDVIMLGILSRPEAAGIYAAAAKIGFLAVVAMEVLWKALLPRLSRLARDGGAQGTPEFRRAFAGAFATVAAFLLPVSVAGVASGPALVRLFYGEEFAAAGGIFQVLAVSYLALALGWFLGNSLVAAGRQGAYFPPLAAAAAVALLALMWLIPRHDAVGAAWAMLAGHGSLFVALLLVCRRWFSRRSLAAAALMAAGVGAMVLVLAVAGPVDQRTAPLTQLAATALALTAYAALVAAPLRLLLRHVS